MSVAIEPAMLLAFLPVSLLLNVTPGPDMLFCLGQGLRAGPRPAVAAALGVGLGVMVHVLVAGLGLAALMQAWPGFFEAVRWAGVAYLLWVAWRTVTRPMATASDRPIRPRRAFVDGMAVNLLNPKVVLFVLALVPQFVVPAAGPVLPQFLALGAIVAVGGIVVNGAVGVSAGGIGQQLARSPVAERALRWATATLFLGLAVRLAVERR